MRFLVSTAAQTITVFDGRQPVWAAPVSTSKFGPGEESGSHCTPRGLHRVCEKIGAGAPLGSIFKSRLPTGKIWTQEQLTEEDLILTRILWLDGLEPANRNSRERYIYFHGTNQEDSIGTPSSIGCIRLRNDDVIRLFDYAEIGTEVLIQ